ncbi:serine/threonine protein kinase [Mixta intestinalis]|jgi:serine/threonine protein kinase|uniref:Serine/threonine-protein kinase PK-1 n=1 Tax=Mixta intestinalis TaxID=1615494 RepID=A0A6P1Q642_9GAMM|nr:serine/threonine-protein kinase [Mixta intestinalis]QHM73911.1 Serine/threonine-protein kinase PK-1 [Mixta intestinalis]
MSEHDNNRTVPNALPPGYRFNEFEIKDVIGGGGFGIVYRAWDHQLERTIAIKEFMPASLAVRGADLNLVLRSERFSKTFHAGLNSFIQEARLLARFNHPNLLHVLRFWVQNDTAYMGTVFYSGTTLSRLAAARPDLINEAWIRRLLPPLFGAINTIHREGYLHRDISLDNIQLQDNWVPVLLDFGSARQTIGNLSDESETMLRPGFAPIEQYSDNNESEQGPWTDIYALGAVLHTLIVGSPPPVSVVRSIEDNYRPLSELRPAGFSLPLLHAIDKALALNPVDRPQSIDAFAALMELSAAELNDILNAESEKPGTMLVAVEPEESATTVTALLKRYMWPGLAAAGVVLGIIVGVLLGSGSDAPPVATTSGPPITDQTLATVVPPVQAAEINVTPPKPPAPQRTAPAPEPVAQIYIKLQHGEDVALNGSPQVLEPAPNGFASLQLPPGEYDFAISNNGQIRQQKIRIERKGVWLINPQG